MQEDRNTILDAAFHISNTFSEGRVSLLSDSLPHVPTMASTQLRLELLLQEPWIDLGAVSEVILSDPGATLQVLRLIGEEYTDEEERPTRIEECVVCLSMDRWYDAVCALTIPHDSQVSIHWEYLRRVARCARELAQCVDGFSPEEAYLVGLLSQVGTMPELLGWNKSAGSSMEHDAIGVMLADYWNLPSYLRAAIEEHHNDDSAPRWHEIMQMARTMAAHRESNPAQD